MTSSVAVSTQERDSSEDVREQSLNTTIRYLYCLYDINVITCALRKGPRGLLMMRVEVKRPLIPNSLSN